MNGNGVYQDGLMNMHGDITIADDNDVFLPTSKFVTVDGTLTSPAKKVARFTPEDYELGRKLVEVDYDGKKASEIFERFTLTPKDEFLIRPGDFVHQ